MKARPALHRTTAAIAGWVATVVAGLVLAAGSAQAAAITYTVDSTADTNLSTCNAATPDDCTLRGAINAANANPGADTIDFNIPGTGVRTITSSTSALPVITDQVTINGYSQPGASPNTQTLAQGDNAVLLIELTGTRSSLVISGGTTTGGAPTGGSGSTIEGLVANSASLTDQIQIEASDVTIAGNFISVDPTGTTSMPSGSYGVRQEIDTVGDTADDNTIGGGGDAARNVISGGDGGIILVDGARTQVAGNYIGTNAAGTGAVLTTGGDGINVLGGTPFTVTNTTIVGNLISGNANGGIAMNSGGEIRSNLIGTQRDGTSPLGNGNFGGIDLGLNDPVTVGGDGSVDANTIAFNANNGINVAINSSQKDILGNSIYSNGEDVGGLGISLLDSVFPLANDPGDPDTIPGNLGQNYPVLSSASVSAGQAHISGTLNSIASTTYHLEFFSNTACNTPSPLVGAPPADFGEGQTFLGSASVTTDGSGNASFAPPPFTVPSGQTVITSTATDPSGNTSEFSECLTATVANTPPTANNDSYNATENQTLTVGAPGVLANDSDPESDPLTAHKVSGPTHGSLTLNSNGSFSYTPAANYSGPDSFTYRANDGKANSNTATVSLNVRPVNHRPVARNDSYRTHQNQTLTVSAPGTLKNDSDPDHDRLTAHLLRGPKHGSLTLHPDGSLRYVPRHGFSGSDSFTYHAADGRGGVSNTATVHLTVRRRISCIVPRLLHDTLAESKKLLASHHCVLGTVTGAQHGTVASFSPRAGTVLAAGSPVALRLKAARRPPSFTG